MRFSPEADRKVDKLVEEQLRLQQRDREIGKEIRKIYREDLGSLILESREQGEEETEKSG